MEHCISELCVDVGRWNVARDGDVPAPNMFAQSRMRRFIYLDQNGWLRAIYIPLYAYDLYLRMLSIL